jgi:hypothetical protein
MLIIEKTNKSYDWISIKEIHPNKKIDKKILYLFLNNSIMGIVPVMLKINSSNRLYKGSINYENKIVSCIFIDFDDSIKHLSLQELKEKYKIMITHFYVNTNLSFKFLI